MKNLHQGAVLRSQCGLEPLSRWLTKNYLVAMTEWWPIFEWGWLYALVYSADDASGFCRPGIRG
ncbi:MAG: hypothetical protein WC560_03140 [Syntrophales bacterium]